jgi:membrane associated rhomboid family serine protease
MNNKRPLITISFTLISFTVMVMAPIFDSSVYGVNGHPTEWLSFLPNAPFRHMGLSLFFSPFLHINFQHLITNILIFLPVAMMIERKRSGAFLAVIFFSIHFQVLILLAVIDVFYPLDGKAFLGSSHVIIGLYSFWALTSKKMSMLYFGILLCAVGFFQSQGALTLLAHTLGLCTGIALLIPDRFGSKLRSKRPN